MTAPQLPLPRPTEFTQPFWDAAAAGTLVLQRCADCRAWQWTPYPACTSCTSERLEWTAASGRGSVYSWSVVQRPQTAAFTPGYVVAIVELDEGPRMLTNLVDVARDDIRIGLRVEVAFRTERGCTLYPFRPLPESRP